MGAADLRRQVTSLKGDIQAELHGQIDGLKGDLQALSRELSSAAPLLAHESGAGGVDRQVAAPAVQPACVAAEDGTARCGQVGADLCSTPAGDGELDGPLRRVLELVEAQRQSAAAVSERIQAALAESSTQIGAVVLERVRVESAELIEAVAARAASAAVPVVRTAFMASMGQINEQPETQSARRSGCLSPPLPSLGIELSLQDQTQTLLSPTDAGPTRS